MPIQRPVPIWIGAFVEPAIKRAARLADGWQSQFEAPDETAKRAYQAFRDEVQRVGRNPADVGIEATCFARGTDPTAWTRLVEDYLACGATQLVFRPEGTFSQIADAMQRFAPFVADLTRR
jgi:alkanesulfonate monooxygenase SsuD/methylene tetrahydromethanopterin reductase-like flavin-dependent oxidoreductase (luciferase family)